MVAQGLPIPAMPAGKHGDMAICGLRVPAPTRHGTTETTTRNGVDATGRYRKLLLLGVTLYGKVGALRVSAVTNEGLRVEASPNSAVFIGDTDYQKAFRVTERPEKAILRGCSFTV